VTALLVAAAAAPVVVIAWLLLTPLGARVHVEGGLESGVRFEARLRFAPLGADVRSGPPLDVRVMGRPLNVSPRGRGDRTHPPLGERLADADAFVRFLVQRRRDLVVRRIDGDVTYGLEDPALTGQLHGLVSVLRPTIDPDARVAWRPDWSMRDVLDGRLDVDLRLYAGRFALALGWFLLSRYARRRRVPMRPRRRPARSDTSRTAPAPVG
jgi:hypothetical protein